MNKKIEEVIREQFPQAKFDPNDPHLGLGSFPEWDSLGTFSLLLLIEQTYAVRFSTEEMAELKTVAAIRERLAKQGVNA